MKIFIASDHAGFKLKNQIKNFLQDNDFVVYDLGPMQYNPKDDYSDYAKKLAEKMKNEKDTKGILICSSGVGVCIAANKFSYIRAFNAFNSKLAAVSRKEDNTNVICFGQKFISFKKAKKILKVWLKTKFSNKERHKRRLKKIKNYD